MKSVTKFAIPTALLVSLGANTYFVAGGAEQYAVAAEITNHQSLLSDKRQCTDAQRELIAPILTDHILAPLNVRFGTSMSVLDMRPLNRVSFRVDIYVPLDDAGIPQAGAPTGPYCQIERNVWSRLSKSLAVPGE